MHLRLWHELRIPLTALAALCAAVVVVAIIAYVEVGGGGSGGQTPGQTLSDEQKLSILASLHSSSTVSTSEKRDVLNKFSPDPSTTPSSEEKLRILNSLRSK